MIQVIHGSTTQVHGQTVDVWDEPFTRERGREIVCVRVCVCVCVCLRVRVRVCVCISIFSDSQIYAHLIWEVSGLLFEDHIAHLALNLY